MPSLRAGVHGTDARGIGAGLAVRPVEAQALYLRYCHAIGFERLSALFGDVFGVTISEGPLATLFKRVKPRFDD